MSQEDVKEKKRKHSSPRKVKHTDGNELSKKQKTVEDGDQVNTVELVRDDTLTPILAIFPGVTVPESTEFNLYYSQKQRRYLIHGGTERMEFEGRNEPKEDLYYIGIYDPDTSTVELSAAPVISTNRTIKAYKNQEIAEIKQVNVQRRLQRNALGEAFGTKRAKKAIDDLERNEIDATQLETYADAIIDNVKSSTVDLPSLEMLQEMQGDKRPIPLCNQNAATVEDIYPLSGILSKEELGAIKVGALLREKDATKRAAMLPFKTSNYINDRIARITNENETQTLKLLYYASLLMGLYTNKRVSSKGAIMLKLNHPAEVLVNGLIAKFTEQKAAAVGKEKDAAFLITPKNEDKILCYLFATCLHIDQYTVQTPPLVTELSLRPARATQLFKSMGCKIKPCTVAQKEALGLTTAEAAHYKLATLSLPFKLPEAARRRAAAASRR
ncbi:RNA polymerase I associated factor, A49-like protein [Limtongia smithiae]|uniref:RNA polymerase I associated factor, A49-like protein n=1 Tax=Limtongia smithiae TaxID=1125753 RepID=UPI0034CE144F